MEAVADAPIFTAFEKYEEFKALQESLLVLDMHTEPTVVELNQENIIIGRLRTILDEYQEQAHLLDRYLEELVTPVAQCLKGHAQAYVSNPEIPLSASRMDLLAQLLFHYVKFRGYKTITKHFPHEAADVPILLGFVHSENSVLQEPTQWPLRHILLLWTSLICMIPFDFSQFDPADGPGSTADFIENYGKTYLAHPGVERDSAVVLLSRFYRRKDCLPRYAAFLQHYRDELASKDDVFLAVGTLHLLSEIAKTGAAELTADNALQVLEIADVAEATPSFANNTVARKLMGKLRSRVAVRLLPPRRRAIKRGLRLGGGTVVEEVPDNLDLDISDQDIEVVEVTLDKLFEKLQDKDTVVRWSAAKNLGRIAERLPNEFNTQILDTVLGLFSIYPLAEAGIYDLPSTAEAPWHGACLASAQMVSRGLVGPQHFSQLIQWLFKALFFDIRKGSHSIGAKVRDAAAYVVWALARSINPAILATCAEELAKKLITVSLFDREVHIRRAASAAFQEHVGRTSLFPHGIDVLRMTDFYAVSLRRNAFLVAAPEVASFTIYRHEILEHLTGVTLRHWDPSMRQLGSQALQLICLHDIRVLIPQVIPKLTRLLSTSDVSDTHGGLLALVELARAYKSGGMDLEAQELIAHLALVPSKVVLGMRNSLVTVAACDLITETISKDEIKPKSNRFNWRALVDHGLKHRSEEVQQAAANTMGAASSLVNCSEELKKYVHLTTHSGRLKSGTMFKQQSLGRLVGALDYKMNPECLPFAIQCLLGCTSQSSTVMKMNIEARRNCCTAIAQLVSRVGLDTLSPKDFIRLYTNLLIGLTDYTIDERGDVGSWVRIACMRGLEVLQLSAFDFGGIQHLQSHDFHAGVSGILKQGVERLDNVRHVAGEVLGRISRSRARGSHEVWKLAGEEVIQQSFFAQDDDERSWSNSETHFTRAIRLLDIEEYRKDVLRGLVMSIGSKTDATQRCAGASLVGYASELPVSEGNYTLAALSEDLLDIMRPNMSSNNIVIPVLQTFNVLFGEDILVSTVNGEALERKLQELLDLITRSIKRLKNPLRISQSMKIICQLLASPALYEACVHQVNELLVHPFPRVRAETAEYFYIVLQTKDLEKETDEAEEILLETEWISDSSAAGAVDKLRQLL